MRFLSCHTVHFYLLMMGCLGSGCHYVSEFSSGVLTLSESTTASIPQVTPSNPTPLPVIHDVFPTEGPSAGGTELIILGSGFEEKSQIFIGELPCQSFQWISSQRIECITPASSSGFKTISILSTSQLSIQADQAFYFIGPPPQLIGTALGSCGTPQTASICPKAALSTATTLVTLIGMGFSSATQVFLGGQICCGIAVSSPKDCTQPYPTSLDKTTLPETLTCYAPMNALGGAVDLFIINPDGQSTSSHDTPFNYLGAAPSNLRYSLNPVTYYVGRSSIQNFPIVTSGNSLSYSITPSLPAGLTLHPFTGIMSGTPLSSSSATNYTITATNVAGSTSVNVQITVVQP